MEESHVIPQTAPPKKSIFRRLYDWTLSWAETRYGTPALFAVSFTESSLFPMPPDPLQIALSASKPKRAFWYGTVCVVGSLLGAMLGFLIGYIFWEVAQDFFFDYVPGFTEERFETVRRIFEGNIFLIIIVVSFTPLPYNVFMISAGALQVPLLLLCTVAVVIGAIRFYLTAAIMHYYGPAIRHWIEKYFNIVALVCILITLLVVGIVVAMWMM